jgi:hypothetical protein
MAASIWYERSLKALAKKGYRKSPVQTPEEFLRSISDQELREPASRFTEHYERARFADSAPDAAKLPELFQEISGGRR